MAVALTLYTDMHICCTLCRQEVIDSLFRKSKSGRLKLESKKPVVLVLGTGWGAHSLVKVRSAHAA